eukprot:4384138-Amphidinium_carterae.2
MGGWGHVITFGPQGGGAGPRLRGRWGNTALLAASGWGDALLQRGRALTCARVFRVTYTHRRGGG